MLVTLRNSYQVVSTGPRIKLTSFITRKSAASTATSTSLAARTSIRSGFGRIAFGGSCYWLVDDLDGWIRLPVRVLVVIIALVYQSARRT